MPIFGNSCITCQWACVILLAGVNHVQGAALRFTVLDLDTGKPVPCRIHLKDADGKAVHPKGFPFWYDHFVCPGVADLDVVPGPYTYEIERGPEYNRASGKVIVSESGPQHETTRLTRLITLSK